MDTKTFLVDREAIQDRLEALRILTSGKRASAGWWRAIPILPIAGMILASRVNGARHPILKRILVASAGRFFGELAERFGPKQEKISPLRRVLSFL